MLADDLSVFGLWDLTRPAVPPRSRLYHLEPMGMGTPYVESLTGYVARLAEAHGVRARKLLVAEILPLMGHLHLLGPGNRGLSAFWQRETRALNSTRTLARDLVHALEGLTLRRDLRFLTLLPWAEVLPPRGLVRPHHAWCPACYEEWRQAGQVVYEPLLWSLMVVNSCSRHRQRLRSACPYPDCQRLLPPLAQQSRPGHCPWCERWLGREQEPVGDEGLTQDELQWEGWVTRAVGELLAAAPGLSVPLGRELVAQAIDRQVRRVTGGNGSALADRLGVRMVTLSTWRRGRSIPCLGPLLRVCYRLGTEPLGFLSEDGTAATVRESDQAVPLESPRRPRAGRGHFDGGKVQRALESVLASDESPPPSLREIARRVGVHPSSLSHHLPKLCRAISARCLAYQREKGAMNRQRLCAEIRQAVYQVHGWGLYPSAGRVASLISQPGFMRHHEAPAAWKEALRELGWRA